MAWQVFKINNGKHEFVGEIDEPADCDGDSIYDVMEERGWIASFENYEVDGDSQSIAVMCKDGSEPDFSIQFFDWK